MVRKLFLIAAIALLPVLSLAQQQPITGTISANGGCVTYRATNNSTVGIIVTGTFSGTITPSINIFPARPINKKVLPVDGSTAQSTITATGGFIANIAGFAQFDLCATAWTSGSAVIDMFATPAPNNSTIAGVGGGFTAAGDLSGSSSSQEVVGVLNKALPALASGCLDYTGSTWTFFACGSGSGTVNSGSQYVLPIYPNSGSNAVVGPSSSLISDAAGDLSIAGNETATQNATSGSGGGQSGCTQGVTQQPLNNGISWQCPGTIANDIQYVPGNSAPTAGFWETFLVATGPSATCTVSGGNVTACGTGFSAGSASGTNGYASCPPAAISTTGAGSGATATTTCSGTYPNFIPTGFTVINQGSGYTGTVTVALTNGVSPENVQHITQIPIGNVGTSGLSGSGPIAIAAGGAISCATCTTNASALTSGQVMIGGGGQASAVSANVAIAAGTLTAGVTGQTGTLCVAGTTAGVTACLTTGAAGLTVIAPTGTLTNPGLNFVSNNSSSGWVGNGAGGAEWASSGVAAVLIGATGAAVPNGNAYSFNRTGSRELGLDDETAATGGAVAGIGSTTNGNEGGLLRDANVCRITADVSLTVNTPNSFCSFSVGGTARGWGFVCDILWAITAGTGTNNFALGVNASQTPTGTTNAGATILTSLTGTETLGTGAISASGATNILTGATYTPAATIETARIYGTVLTSATAGTFAITATANGTTATAAVKAGTICQLL